MLALLYGAGLQRSEAVALQLADYDQVSGAITVRNDERQVYATNSGKEAIDAGIARRGDGQAHSWRRWARAGASGSRA